MTEQLTIPMAEDDEGANPLQNNQSPIPLGSELIEYHHSNGDLINASDTPKTIIHEDGLVLLYEDFFTPALSAQIFKVLLAQVDWQQEYIKIYGKTHPSPRLTAWYGDAAHTYSGINHLPCPWLPLLYQLKTIIEPIAHSKFNSVLLNLYRNGQDSMGWHSDDEPELGENPSIASLSFGSQRRFHFKHKADPLRKVAVDLKDGSLLLMQGGTQHYWRHQLPKTMRPVPPRINLTFRWVHHLPVISNAPENVRNRGLV